MAIVKFQKGITPNAKREELWFLWSVHHLMMLYISIKFHENISNDFQVVERTQFSDRQTDRRADNQGKNNMSAPFHGET